MSVKQRITHTTPMVRRMTARIFAICGVAMFSIIGRVSAASPDTLTDKTLVVWAAPANLAQRGGSALTLDDQNGHFDGIVFGELAPGKWMAGSDFYRRSEKQQTANAAETVDANTPVQIAVVYRGRQISIYRNAKLYAQYTIDGEPQSFGPRSSIIFGKRHRDQGDGAHFAGAIDDARIYDRPLTIDEIAALKPNVVSLSAPWAWWTFDTPAAKERTGRFAIAQLGDGAKVEHGKLVLDGKSATLVAKQDIPFAYETPTVPSPLPTTWLTYHLAHPGPGTAMPGDPNCAFYWKGQYHLHYIYRNQDGFSFAHVSSDDMVHWKWHPTTLTPPKTGHGMFSGTGFFTKEGRPAIVYHGEGSGKNQIALAADDRLEKWSPIYPIEIKLRPDQDGSKISQWDPDAWIEADNYYALFGGHPGSGKPPTLLKSPDLKQWDYVGLFLSHDMPDVGQDEDISCPNFFKLGDERMLLCISHNKGCRYYLGAWKDEKFSPRFHGRMNWSGWDFFAPESVLTGDGRRVMWAWCLLKDLPLQSGIQSLPRELSLPADGILRIKPLRELERLRGQEQSAANVTVGAGSSRKIDGITGDTLEIKATFSATKAARYGLRVFTDSAGQGGFPIAVEPASKSLMLGTMKIPFELPPNENLELRVFLDKNMIEVFAGDRQAAVAQHKYAAADVGVSAFADGAEAVVKEISGWRMTPIYGQ